MEAALWCQLVVGYRCPPLPPPMYRAAVGRRCPPLPPPLYRAAVGRRCPPLRCPHPCIELSLAAAAHRCPHPCIGQAIGRRFEEDFNNFHDFEHWPGAEGVGSVRWSCSLAPTKAAHHQRQMLAQRAFLIWVLHSLFGSRQASRTGHGDGLATRASAGALAGFSRTQALRWSGSGWVFADFSVGLYAARSPESRSERLFPSSPGFVSLEWCAAHRNHVAITWQSHRSVLHPEDGAEALILFPLISDLVSLGASSRAERHSIGPLPPSSVGLGRMRGVAGNHRPG